MLGMATTVTVSQKLRLAVWAKRAEGTKQHELARSAEVNLSVFSSLVNDHIPLRDNDERVLRIAKVLGIPPEEAFTRHER